MKNDILICDDAAFMRMMIKDILEKNGYTIAGEAENGKVTVEKYKSLRPSLVLLDSVMPVMDGMEALRSILELDPLANIVMFFVKGEEVTMREAIQLGAKDIVLKPFSAEGLLDAVKKILGSTAC